MIRLRYGNTNTFYISGLLVDTDYAGTLPAFYRALKGASLQVRDIRYVLATHFHPDHMGLVGELARQGVQLLLVDTQLPHVHFSDTIFARDGIPFTAVDESRAEVITCAGSREFLTGLGISGEIIHTPSHSPDSISLVLDDGDCLVGDLEPYEYIAAYDDNAQLKKDWSLLLSHHPKRIYYAHAPERLM